LSDELPLYRCDDPVERCRVVLAGRRCVVARGVVLVGRRCVEAPDERGVVFVVRR